MRICLTFSRLNGVIRLSFNYHEHIQGLIYRNLPESKAEILHNQGFRYEKRSFRLFTFSRILGKRPRIDKNRRQFVFQSPIKLLIASPIQWILEDVAETILKRDEIILDNNRLMLESISVYSSKIFTDKVKIKMLSPMAISSTFQKPDGKKIRHYYVPGDEDFSDLMTQNLKKKYSLVFDQERDGEVKIRKLPGKGKEHVLRYKGTVIKAWDGVYEIQGDPELIQISYDCGLGEKNSQGFGMWEEVRDFTAEARRTQR